MEFLNVGIWELTVILLIAILFAGPERIADLSRKLGRFLAEIRGIHREFTGSIHAEIEGVKQETNAAIKGTTQEESEGRQQEEAETVPEKDSDKAQSHSVNSPQGKFSAGSSQTKGPRGSRQSAPEPSRDYELPGEENV